jgi:secondary thiamine-phosphate synthase enzyme
MVEILTVTTHKQGLVEFTALLEDLVSQAKIDSGICNLHIQHTSASLVIQENADPSAQADLENWINRLVPERDALYTHIYEGLDVRVI